jgi:hypothetical protein
VIAPNKKRYANAIANESFFINIRGVKKLKPPALTFEPQKERGKKQKH